MRHPRSQLPTSPISNDSRISGIGSRSASRSKTPGWPPGKRLVRREVVEVVTPGLVGDPDGHRGRSHELERGHHSRPEQGRKSVWRFWTLRRANLRARHRSSRSRWRWAAACGPGRRTPARGSARDSADRRGPSPDSLRSRRFAALLPNAAQHRCRSRVVRLRSLCDPGSTGRAVDPRRSDTGLSMRAAAALLSLPVRKNQPFALTQVPRVCGSTELDRFAMILDAVDADAPRTVSQYRWMDGSRRRHADRPLGPDYDDRTRSAAPGALACLSARSTSTVIGRPTGCRRQPSRGARSTCVRSICARP